MMNWSDGNLRAVEFHLHELRVEAARNRLARQVRRTRPRRWRHRLGTALIAAGEAMAGPALDLACQSNCAPSRQSGT